MDEQRIREIVKEELAELLKSIRPTVVIVENQQVNADSVVDRFSKLLNKSHIPDNPWS